MDSNLECLTIQNISKLDINQDVSKYAIDIVSSFAQKYLEYLLTLIHLNKPVDFIQAALVMQTLSSVFAKKVDHLQEQVLRFTVVFRKLELGRQIESNEAGGDAEGEDIDTRERERNRAAKKKNEREAMLHKFENVCHNISHIRKSCIKKFNAEEIKKSDPFLIRHKTNECPRLKAKDDFSCYIYDSKEEVLGRKEEFSVNGVLCNEIIPKDDFCLSCIHGEGPTIDDSAYIPPPELPLADESVFNEPMAVDDAPLSPIQPSPSNDVQSYQNVVEEFLNNSNHDESDTSGFVYFEKMNKVEEAIVDYDQMIEAIWNPVSGDNKLIERRLQKRDVCKVPDFLRKDKKEDRPYTTKYVLSDLLLGMFKTKSDVPFSCYFTKGFKEEAEFRRKSEAKQKNKRKRRRNQPVTDNEEEFRGFDDFGQDDEGIFEAEHDVVPFDGAVFPTNDNDSFFVPHTTPINDDYAQTVAQHIEAYQRSQNHHDDTINEIASKVSLWHDSLRPILEREEERTCFDIHEYGSKILDCFPRNNGKNTLSFGDIVKNESREEIPRFFLSSLLLANSYNVEITKENNDELSINDMNLTLLSRVRQHETLDQDMRKEFS